MGMNEVGRALTRWGGGAGCSVRAKRAARRLASATTGGGARGDSHIPVQYIKGIIVIGKRTSLLNAICKYN